MLLRETNISDEIIDCFSLRLLSVVKCRSFQKYTTDVKMRDSEWKDKGENRKALNVFCVLLDGKRGIRAILYEYVGRIRYTAPWGLFSSGDTGPG